MLVFSARTRMCSASVTHRFLCPWNCCCIHVPAWLLRMRSFWKSVVGFLKNRSCTCSVAWKLHRYDISSDGSVARKIEGAVGRIDYHVVVSVPHNSGFMHHDVGHVYHATDWKQNTYHPTGPLPPCTRALVVSGHDALVLALRTAFAASWLALSGHESVYCVLPRIHSPSVLASGHSTLEEP